MMNYCLGCQTTLKEIDKDPNGEKNYTCARCRAEEKHDFDTHPDAQFNRQGRLIEKSCEENPYQMTSALRPAAENLLYKQFGTSKIILLEDKHTQTDYLAHIDLICRMLRQNSHRPRVEQILNISDELVLNTHSLGIDWKRASYKNWHTDHYLTAPFSASLLEDGCNEIILWIYESDNGCDIDGWIAALWSNELAAHIERYLARFCGKKLICKAPSNRNGKHFWFIELHNLLTFFRRYVLGFDLEKLAPLSPNLKNLKDLDHYPRFKRNIRYHP